MSDEPEIRPEESSGEKRSAGRLGLISVLLLVLIGAVVYYLYLRRQDPGFRPWTIVQRAPKGDATQLGRRVTFFSISPLTAAYCCDGDKTPDGIRSTIYTKIGSKAVPASGRLDLYLYEYQKGTPDGKGGQVYSWTGVKLPDSAEWGGWPLGGWSVSLPWAKYPAVSSVWVEAVYTNPTGKIFRAAQGPIQIAG